MAPLKLYITICFSVLLTAFSQESVAQFRFGDFNSACSISISPNGFLYVCDSGNNEVVKYDTLGNELKRIGGFGWDDSAFDNPADIFATTLNVYVSDKNNNRIQIFDRDLNFLSSFTTRQYENRDYQFGYPISCVTSAQGDLFILDSDNMRVIKYNLTGEYLTQIGSYDSGDYMLSDPQKLAVSGDGKLFVIDGENVIVFDYYGNGLLKLNPGFKPDNINITFNYLVLNNGTTIKYLDLRNPSTGFLNYFIKNGADDTAIIDALIYNSKIYLLTENSLSVENLQ